MKVTVLKNQGIFDIALQTQGTIKFIPQIMRDNNLQDFPPQLQVGQVLNINVNFENYTQKVASETITKEPIATNNPRSYGGVGAMQIENDFIVS